MEDGVHVKAVGKMMLECLVRLAGWLAGWLISCERKILFGWIAGWFCVREKYCCGWQIPAESASRTRRRSWHNGAVIKCKGCLVTAPAFISLSWVAPRLSFSFSISFFAAWFAFVLGRRKQTLPPRLPMDGQILMPPRLLLVCGCAQCEQELWWQIS